MPLDHLKKREPDPCFAEAKKKFQQELEEYRNAWRRTPERKKEIFDYLKANHPDVIDDLRDFRDILGEFTLVKVEIPDPDGGEPLVLS